MTNEEAINHLGTYKFRGLTHTVAEFIPPPGEWQEAMEMAISALREQQNHVPELGKMIGWISVEERLPGDDLTSKEIIVCIKNRWNETRVSVIHWWGLERTNNMLFWPDITHWMPMPEAPKEA